MSEISQINTFETEELIYNAKMSYGDMDKMANFIDILGERLFMRDLQLQTYMLAAKNNLPDEKVKQIKNGSIQYIDKYLNRFTTEEMKRTLEEAGYYDLAVVLVDGEVGDEAIENGREVLALKDGEIFCLDEHGEASEHAKMGYLIAMSSHDYEAYCIENSDFSLDEI